MTFLQCGARDKAPAPISWRVGAYLRLSKEDGDKPESDSIQNQQRIIENHLAQLQRQGEVILSITFYTDDGYAGGNFCRPGYEKLIREIEAGAVNCVIFKDLSRLGRNYPELGRLMEDYFPEKGVRVISVLNSLDSVKSPESYCSAIVSFSNIVNDDYIRQLSAKIKCTLDMKRAQGEFIGNYAPFGYQKSPQDRHRLEPDPEAVQVVKTIFRWYLEGASAAGIVKRLNALCVPPPAAYKAAKGCKGFRTQAGRGTWSVTTVSSMLRDEVYIGNLVQGKFKSASYRSKKLIPNDESAWIVVEGTHQAIISDEQFAAVHMRLVRRARVPPRREETYLLSGLIFCGMCGRRYTRCTSNGRARYRCPTRTYAPDRCGAPSMLEEALMAAVLEALQVWLTPWVDAPAALAAAGAARGVEDDTGGDARAIERTEREKTRLMEAKFKLYDSLQRGLISQEEYQQFHGQYQQALAAQEASAQRLRAELAERGAARQEADTFVRQFAQAGILPKLDRVVMTQLVDRIVVTSRDQICVYLKCSAGHGDTV